MTTRCGAEMCPYWPGEGCLRGVLPCPPEPPPSSEPDFDPFDPEYPSYEWRRELLSDD